MSGKTARASVWVIGGILLAGLGAGVYRLQSPRSAAVRTIAFVPQTTGAMLWDVEHVGATAAAEKVKCHLYWNAPTSETDVAGQVSQIDRIGRGKYQGLVLAPNHPLAILSPLRRVLAAGLPVVIVSSPLDLPPGDKLGFIVNDDEKMGELAATEIAKLLHGSGSIALVGLARSAPGVMLRVRGAERVLNNDYPNIHIVSRLGGAYNTASAEEFANGAVDSHPALAAILSFTATSTKGVYAALKSRSLQKTIRLVGCEQDADLISYVDNGEVAAVLAENTYRMGYDAVGLIAASWAGKPVPPRSVVPPLLITRQNFNTAAASLFISFPR